MTPEVFNRYAIWDPCFCQHDGRWYLYALAMDRAEAGHREAIPFWQRHDVVLGFVSDDFEAWEPLGVVFEREAVSLCAGCVVSDGGRLHLFLAENLLIKDGWHVDQRLIYLSSSDGRQFTEGQRPLEPTLPAFATGRRSSQGPCFGCRDPYYTWDATIESHRLYVVTGGYRWDVAPRVVTARADKIEGPYTVDAIALDGPFWNDAYCLAELERVSVAQVDGIYKMVGHCWKAWVYPQTRKDLAELGEPVGDSTLWFFEAPAATGPFQLNWALPVMRDCRAVGQYGTHIQQHNGEYIGLGWYKEAFEVRPRCAFTVDWRQQAVRLRRS